MNLAKFPRRIYTPYETPLQPLDKLTAVLGGGPRIWMKRDDMLGLAMGGNKTRKLEFLMADALAKGADTIITCGAVQSNHCRLTLALPLPKVSSAIWSSSRESPTATTSTPAATTSSIICWESKASTW